MRRLCRPSGDKMRCGGSCTASPIVQLASWWLFWRTIVQYFKCLPTQIISREYHLAYQPMRNKKGDAGGFDTPAWSSTLCKPLSRIVFHPLWIWVKRTRWPWPCSSRSSFGPTIGGHGTSKTQPRVYSSKDSLLSSRNRPVFGVQKGSPCHLLSKGSEMDF